MLPFDNYLLKNYKSFEAVNKNTWDILSHVNTHYDSNAILSISKILFPEFTVKDNCIFISFMLERKGYERWKNASLTDQELERTINSFELFDYFGLSHSGQDNSDTKEMHGKLIAELLVQTWQIAFTKAFPDKNYEVAICDTSDFFDISLFRKS